MQNNSENNYQEWLKKAEDDELNAKSILKHRDGTPSGVCFLSQQMAEKCLKMLLVYNKQDFPKTHDLLVLESLVSKITPEIKKYKNELDILSGYYTETRYPGEFPEFSWKDAEEAFGAALNIKNFVLSKIK